MARLVPCLLFLLLLSCASGPPPARPAPRQPAPAPEAKPQVAEPVTVEGGSKVTTPAGARLLVPAGFTALQRGNLIELRPPDGEVKVFLVELGGKDCARAVRQAWAAADPAARWKLHSSTRPPSSKGYDAILVESYVPTKERRHAQAVAWRKGERIWVALVSGAANDLARRDAQIATFLTSLEAPGIEKVDLKGKKPASIATPGSRAALKTFIEGALEATGTPGLSIAVVEGGKVALAEGYGVLRRGKPAPVTADTLMMIGSVTKSLTTLMMATAVDRGKLSWERKVTQVDPRFRLADEALTRKLTLEHLVCACAGLPRKDLPLVLAFSGKTWRDVFKELAGMRPTTGFRETFQYQNHMVAAGGYLTARALAPRARDLDRVYQREMQRRIFGPLGMKATTFSHSAARRARNRAIPYSQDLTAKHHEVSLEHETFVGYIRPSGGIWSTARDMARYIITELNRGVAPSGKRVVSEANLTHRWKPQVKASAETAYGLGWGIHEIKGLRLITHTGGTMGFATWVGFLPETGVGVVMLSNGTGGHLVEGVTWRRLVELWFGVDDRAQARLDHVLGMQRQELAKLKQRLATPDAAWIKPLLGKHVNAEIGPVTIKPLGGKQGGFLFDAGEYRTPLQRYDRPDGVKTLIFTKPPLAGLQLVPLPEKETFEMRRGQERYVFSRAGR